MTTRATWMTAALIIATTTPFVGQDRPKQNADQSNGGSASAYEKYLQQQGGSRMRPLSDASDVTLRVVPVKANSDEHKRDVTEYRKGENISFHIEVTNNSPETLVVGGSTNLFDQYRLELSKNGEVVPYREHTAKLLEGKSESKVKLYPSYTSMITAQLDSGETKNIGSVDINEWYSALEPGTYRLTIKYSLQIGGKWIELPQVTFTITP